MFRAVFGFGTMLLVVGVLAILMVRAWAPHRWAQPRVRRAVLDLPLVGLLGLAGWTALRVTVGSAWIIDVFSAFVSGVVLLEAALLLSMPVYGLLRWVARRLEPAAPGDAATATPAAASEPLPATPAPAAEPKNAPAETGYEALAATSASAAAPTGSFALTRRALLGTAAVTPVAMGALAMGGLVGARTTARVDEVPMTFADLPPALAGLRILHLSDIHIGLSFSLRDLEGVLEAADAQSPDLVLVTGDLSDRIPELPDALAMIADLKPRHGTFASVGNHEYWRGIEAVRRAHDRSEVPMLLEANHTLKIDNEAGSAELFLAGADDPRKMRGNLSEFLERTVDGALDGQPSDAFTVLMSHRPRGFDAAVARGVELTLSGHTHGGQMGGFGRSIFEPVLEEMYMWGHYQQGESQLYTSAGVGHWFPFRVGCPTEAPLIVLERG